MSKPIDLDQIKQKTVELSKSWHRKLNYLSESVKRSGKEGVGLWLKSHHQLEELEAALGELVAASQDESFKLIQVETTLSSFVLPEEDLGHADWYRAAGQLLDEFEKSLVKDNLFDKNKLRSALNELKFISQSNEFHQQYHLESIQKEVIEVYKNLQKALNDYKALEREKLSTQKNSEKAQTAKFEADKAAAEAKKAMLETVKIKEKRLAILEEKKRKQAEIELAETQSRQSLKESELKAKQAETERQSKLQDAYLDLQMEEKVKTWSLEDVIPVLQSKLEEANIEADLQFKINQLLEEISSADG